MKHALVDCRESLNTVPTKTGAEQECTLKMIMMVILYFYVYVDRRLVKMREGEFFKKK